MLTLAFNIQPVKPTTPITYPTTIVVDGNLTDWAEIVPAIVDEHENVGDDIDRCWLAHNATYIFIRFDNYYASSELEIVYFDTDRNNASGYLVNDIGADYKYVFEGSFYNNLYKWNGTWIRVSEADIYSVNALEVTPGYRDQFEARVNLRDISNPAKVDIVFALEFGDVAPDAGHLTYTIRNVITVPDDFLTIQEAINAANSGDIIYVRAGKYYENLVVNKTVSIFGEAMKTTIIDGNETGDVVEVTACNVTISDFTIRNGGSTYASVRLFTSGINILGNNLTGSWCGVWLEHNSDYNLIANNTIMGNLNGIAGEMWHNNKITCNDIKSNGMGIWMGPYSQNNVISFNNISFHWSEGIMVMQSSNNTFEGNNIIDNNRGGYWAGITIGFQKGFSSGNKFFHNNIANSGKQVELQGEWEPTMWDNGYPSGGNYWSDYAGVDLYKGPYQNETGSDGIGDTPYIIDKNNIDHYPLMSPWTPTPPKPAAVIATIDIQPQALNLRSRGKWITAYIELPEGYDVGDINVSSIMLNGTIPVNLKAPTAIGDYDDDAVPDLMVKFDRAKVINYLLDNVDVAQLLEERFMTITLTITGKLNDGTQFRGSDNIKIIMPMPRWLWKIYPI
jgi:parallel beta-helix repeat protein